MHVISIKEDRFPMFFRVLTFPLVIHAIQSPMQVPGGEAAGKSGGRLESPHCKQSYGERQGERTDAGERDAGVAAGSLNRYT